MKISVFCLACNLLVTKTEAASLPGCERSGLVVSWAFCHRFPAQPLSVGRGGHSAQKGIAVVLQTRLVSCFCINCGELLVCVGMTGMAVVDSVLAICWCTWEMSRSIC